VQLQADLRPQTPRLGARGGKSGSLRRCRRYDFARLHRLRRRRRKIAGARKALSLRRVFVLPSMFCYGLSGVRPDRRRRRLQGPVSVRRPGRPFRCFAQSPFAVYYSAFCHPCQAAFSGRLLTKRHGSPWRVFRHVGPEAFRMTRPWPLIWLSLSSTAWMSRATLGNHWAPYQNTWFGTVKSWRSWPRAFYDLQPPRKQPFDTPASHIPSCTLGSALPVTSPVGVPKGQWRPFGTARSDGRATSCVPQGMPRCLPDMEWEQRICCISRSQVRASGACE
jgi:hypothetical protein